MAMFLPCRKMISLALLVRSFAASSASAEGSTSAGNGLGNACLGWGMARAGQRRLVHPGDPALGVEDDQPVRKRYGWALRPTFTTGLLALDERICRRRVQARPTCQPAAPPPPTGRRARGSAPAPLSGGQFLRKTAGNGLVPSVHPAAPHPLSWDGMS